MISAGGGKFKGYAVRERHKAKVDVQVQQKKEPGSPGRFMDAGSLLQARCVAILLIVSQSNIRDNPYIRMRSGADLAHRGPLRKIVRPRSHGKTVNSSRPWVGAGSEAGVNG